MVQIWNKQMMANALVGYTLQKSNAPIHCSRVSITKRNNNTRKTRIGEEVCKQLEIIYNDKEKKGLKLYVAVSGGSQPALVADAFLHSSIHWEKVHFFFTDERCVPLTHPDSNYEAWNRLFFSIVPLFPFPSILGKDTSYEYSSHCGTSRYPWKGSETVVLLILPNT